MDVSSLSDLLYTCHFMLANVTSIPELMLAEEEAKKFAEAMTRVSRHYDVRATAKTIDMVQLGIVVCTLYGTRAVAYTARVKEEKKNKSAQPQPDNVVQMQQPGMFA